MDHGDSEFVRHVDCPKCGSSDANAEYSDGHQYCFSCGHWQGADGKEESRSVKKVAGLIGADKLRVAGLHTRKITEETCKRFGYKIGTFKGQPVQVAPYFDKEGNLVAQKVRFKNKEFLALGKIKDALPFGSHLWQKSGKQIVVVEGEIDALSMSQAQDNKWPVVSIGCGAGPQIRKYFGKHLAYFRGFDKVVLMFDQDEPGREAAKVAAEVIGMQAYIAELPLKDANEMLKAGRVKELLDAMWRAKQYRPDGIVEISALREESMKSPEYGLSYPWPELTEWTYGIRPNQLIALGAGVGTGKTDFETEIAKHLIVEHKEAVGMFFMEQRPVETATRIAGKIAGKPLHLPDGGWTEEERAAAWDTLEQSGKLYLYDSFGNNEWAPLKEKIEFLHYSAGVNYFFIDHLTALAQWEDDERKTLDVIMSEMGGMVQKMPITIFFVSHLTTPEGKPHEEGGRVMARHLRGSRSIIQWATFILGIERDQQAQDELVRRTSTLRSLKDRFAGKSNGKTMFLRYDFDTGLLSQVDGGWEREEEDEDEDHDKHFGRGRGNI